MLGRSHRAPAARRQLAEVIDRSAALLGMPADWKLGIVPASDTGAVEMAMWSLLGPRPVDVLAFESFSAAWATDAAHHLKLPGVRVLSAPYGAMPDLDAIDPAHDLVLAWNGTTSGVRLLDGPWLRRGDGLVICDATSAAFAMDLPWDRLDVVTWSWQKALGGEAAHGMLALSPTRVGPAGHAYAGVADAEDLPHRAGPLPGRHDQHAVHAVRGGRAGRAALGRGAGRPAGVDRPCGRQPGRGRRWEARTPWASFLASDPAQRSPTSICLRAEAGPAIAALLDAEGVGYDIAAYRDAPPGCGSGEAPRWTPRISRRCCPGWTGRMLLSPRLRWYSARRCPTCSPHR